MAKSREQASESRRLGMQRCTHCITQLTYHVWLLLGIMSFHYDACAGRVWATKRLTTYSALANLALLATIPLLYVLKLPETIQLRTKYLHQNIFAAVTLLRTLAVLFTLLASWLKRGEFMAVLSDFHRLRALHFRGLPLRPQLLRRCEWLVATKFFAGWTSMLGMCTLTFESFGQERNVHKVATTVSLALLTNALNASMTQYFFALCALNLHFQTLNEDLERIVWQSQMATSHRATTTDGYGDPVGDGRQRQRGVFVTLCCRLADELDALAASHHQLQRLLDRVNGLFGVQGLCVFLNLYLNNIALIYMFCSMLSSDIRAKLSTLGNVMFWIFVSSYYLDLWCSVGAMIGLLQSFDKTATLVKLERPHQLMDGRLESSFDNFSMAIARNPLRIGLVGLFYFSTEILFAMGVSTISHLIVLLQHDVKNT